MLDSVSRRQLTFAASLFLASAALVWVTFFRYTIFSAFAAALLKVSFGIGLLAIFDALVMKQIDTLRELREGNLAYAVALLAYAVIFAACIATA